MIALNMGIIVFAIIQIRSMIVAQRRSEMLTRQLNRLRLSIQLQDASREVEFEETAAAMLRVAIRILKEGK